MASQIRRPARAALVKDLNRRGAAFIRDLDRQEPRMVQIAREFQSVAAKVKEIIKDADTVAEVGLVTGAVGLGIGALGLFAAPFTGGSSLVAAAGAVTAVVGVAVAATAKVVQFLRESGKAADLEKLGEEFMKIARPLNEELKEIKELVRELQVEAADCYLSEQLQRIERTLRLVDDASGAIDNVIAFIKSLVQLILKLLMHEATTEEQDELTEKIVKSSNECWKIIKRFREVKEDLLGFKSNIRVLC